MAHIIFGIVLACICALALWNVRLMFFMLPLLFITYLFKVSLLGVPFTLLELSIWTVFIVFIGQHLLFKERRHELLLYIKQEIRPRSPSVLMALFILIATVSLLIVPSEVVFQTGIPEAPEQIFAAKRIALGIWKGWMIPAFLFVLLGQFYIATDSERKKIMLSYVLGAFLVAGLSILSRYVFGLPDTIDGRLGGIFVSANYLVFFVAPAFVYVFVYLLKTLLEKRWSIKHVLKDKVCRLYIPIIITLAVVLFLAKSFASWIAVGMTLVVYLFSVVPKKYKGVGILATIILVGGLFLSQLGTEKLQKFLVFDGVSSSSTRLQVYKISTELLKDNWLTGIGMGQYESQYKVHAGEVLKTAPNEWVMLHPHNLYLSIWLTLGIWGILLLLLMIWEAFRKFFHKKEWLYFLPFLYILLHGFVDTPFWKADAILIFFLVFVVVMSISSKNIKI